MSESMQMWTEVSFNVAYLITVWGLVIAMWRRMPQVAPVDSGVGKQLMFAFGLLALGDTGHVGFRVLAYAMDSGLESTISLFGIELGLVGLGALSTAITVTFFYVLVLLIWQKRFDKQLGWFGWLLLAVAALRLIIMIFPQNQWNSTIPPKPWSLYRNIPLMVQGLGVMLLILRDAAAAKDRTFTWIGVMILLSYTFYTPVILWVQQVPMIGMLMIPKTLAYVAIAVIGYRSLFMEQASPTAQLVEA